MFKPIVGIRSIGFGKGGDIKKENMKNKIKKIFKIVINIPYKIYCVVSLIIVIISIRVEDWIEKIKYKV
jgi:hypothetical protein